MLNKALRASRNPSRAEIRFVELTLYSQYRKLWIRRTKNTYFDPYKWKGAKKNFEVLAQKLLAKGIDPVDYLLVLCVKGKFEWRNYLPRPGYLCKESAIKDYKWLSAKESKKYFSAEQMRYGLTKGTEITTDEILGAVKESVDQLKRVKAKITPAILYAVRDGLRPWYLALRKDFLNEYFAMLDKDERKQIKSCRSFYKQNRWLKQKAEELV